MEMKKFVLIYRSEFTNFECKEKLVVEAIEDKNEMDARGGADGIKVYSGMQRMLNGLLKKAGIEYTEVDDKVCTTEVYKLTGGKDIEFVYKDGKHEYAEGIEPPQSVSEKMIDSNRDMLDYFAELLAHNKIDIEWMLDCLAHEAMHIFVPGKGVLVIDCGYAMTKRIPHRKKRVDPIDNTIYTCNNYRNFGSSVCSEHAIEARTLVELVLKDINYYADIALKDENIVNKLKKQLSTMTEKESSKYKNEHKKLNKRLSELDKLFSNLYEDKVLNRITEYNYLKMSENIYTKK